ncbi:acyl carrier protein [Embleya hyalina]|uniref:Acyl carrier protein n=1 Tax=Embleya hyalina TaxID=516124 RepID=A0A401YMK1_9ACTN|nr:acyl carrier protein [Embleya hyalina]GCD95729.1 acyl carrier protein [Embleya hyalina]
MTKPAPTREELRDFFVEELELTDELLPYDAEFAVDLGIDSLTTMELVVQLEKRYGVRLAEAEFAELTSVNAVHAVLSARLGTA